MMWWTGGAWLAFGAFGAYHAIMKTGARAAQVLLAAPLLAAYNVIVVLSSGACCPPGMPELRALRAATLATGAVLTAIAELVCIRLLDDDSTRRRYGGYARYAVPAWLPFAWIVACTLYSRVRRPDF